MGIEDLVIRVWGIGEFFGERAGRGAFVLAGAAADWDVAEGAAFGPVATACFAEVSGLREAVVVVVAEFGVGGVAARALHCFLFLWPHLPLLWALLHLLTHL